AGQLASAEAIYLYALEHASEKLSLLKNYHVLLVSSGRFADAQIIQSQLDSMDDPSPLNWFQLARSSFEAEEYRDSIRYYRRALALAPYMHEAHLGVARAYHALGETEQA